MLKRLFTSNTRIKLLTLFIANENEEFFIRQLTRKLNEQINSIRRELDNLKKMGFLKSKAKLRKKYYVVNKDFIFFEELKSIIKKALSDRNKIIEDIKKMGDVKMLVLAGVFNDKETKTVDMLIVGAIDKDKFGEYLNNDLKTSRPVKFTILSEDDYKYRENCHDRFLSEILTDEESEILIRKI
ncbi:MAG: hypothetical protein WC806_00680 [Candidatus Gracilibacteria bacterium]|jgi:predicted transcriptional regulator